MFIRAASRRHQRRQRLLAANSFAQLNLPWLAPAWLDTQVRQTATNTHTSSNTQSAPHSRRRKPSTSQPRTAQNRQLTTDQYAPNVSKPAALPPGYTNTFRQFVKDRNAPFDFSQYREAVPVSSLRPYEDPVVVNASLTVPEETIKVSLGLSGTAIELLQHLRTSLQVGRLNRAQAIIQRLGEKCASDSPEVVHAHTAYLEESLRRIALQGRGSEAQQMLKEMQRWFEMEIKSKDVFVDAKMLVVMIRAAIRALSGSQRDRTIRRYAEMGRSLGEDYDEVLQSEDYDDNEFTILGRVASDFFVDQDTVPQELAANESTTDGIKSVHRSDLLPQHDIPEVAPTQQKGEGLSAIKKTMQIFADGQDFEVPTTEEARREKAIEREHLLEQTSANVAIDRWRAADEELRKIGIHSAMQSKSTAGLMWQWQQALVPALEQELADCRKLLSNPGRGDDDRLHYGSYLELLPLDKLAASTIIFALTRFAAIRKVKEVVLDRGLKLGTLAMSLGVSIEQDVKVQTAVTDSKVSFRSSGGFKRTRAVKGPATGHKVSKQQAERNILLSRLEWPQTLKLKLGVMLVSKLIEAAKLPVTRPHPRTKELVTQLQPAFIHRWEYVRGRRIGTLGANQALMEKLQNEPTSVLTSKRMPMVVEPKPWTNWNEGGYLDYSNPVLRLAGSDTSGRDYFMAAHNKGDMKQVYAGLTALGSVPWKVHHGVFKTQVEAWNTGEAIANFAPLKPDLPLPEEPDRSASQKARMKWAADVKAIENKRAGLHSKRCFQNFQLEIARAMVNETLYFPHNLDFRGRAYPIPPYMNHMGADNVRGMLVFAESKELGETGLRWLKIHTATVAGHDKASLDERVAFTMEHLDDIFDSARDPLGGRRWWLQAEDAWQTLAACYELTEALNSPDPTKFKSSIPIQQDGTCNGLQHYAALGGDQIGAEQVNLEPGERPADVYTAVAEAVRAHVRKDAADGNPVAKKLDGNITRKVVKQPVMTNVYGVTYFGAHEQVRRQLEILFPDVSKYDEVNYQDMAKYIVDKIFTSLGTMFKGARAIQDWLGVCAERIATALSAEQIEEFAMRKPVEQLTRRKKVRRAELEVKDPNDPRQSDKTTSNGAAASDVRQIWSTRPMCRQTVVWTTPLRLPVLQPYREGNTEKSVDTKMQRITIHDPKAWHPVSKRKQLQAFPPNFIHSLDATHMMLSAMKCSEQGMRFASIHDSFWTHACDVDRMNVVLRDAFVAMHRDNIVGRLREEFQARYRGGMFLQGVLAHSPLGKKISGFRKARKLEIADGIKQDEMTELAMEVERRRLLESEDPKEVAAGKAMQTPGALVDDTTDPAAFELGIDIESQQLGRIPDGVEEWESTNSDADCVDQRDAANASAAASNPVEATEAAEHAALMKKSKYTQRRKLWVWMPLTFPEVPDKGSFDVEKLKLSTYFFH